MPFNIKSFFSLFKLNLKIWEAEKLIHEYVDPSTQVAPDGFYFEEKTTFFLLTNVLILIPLAAYLLVYI